MMHPCKRISIYLALPLVGASVAKVMARAGNKFGRRIFGKIVKQPLKSNTGTKTVCNHPMAMPCNGFKV